MMVTISLISTNRTIPFHLNSLNTKKKPRHMTSEIQVLTWDRQKCDGVKPVNLTPILTLLVIGSSTGVFYKVFQVVMLKTSFRKSYGHLVNLYQ